MIRHDHTAGTRERNRAPKETEKDEEGGHRDTVGERTKSVHRTGWTHQVGVFGDLQEQ